MTQTVIDWKRLDDLLDELGDDGLQEILEIFLEDTEEMITGLLQADACEWSDRIHGIKGSAQNLGFQELSKLCRDSEWAIKRGEPIETVRFDECYRRSCTVLIEGLPDQIRNSASVVSSVISV